MSRAVPSQVLPILTVTGFTNPQTLRSFKWPSQSKLKLANWCWQTQVGVCERRKNSRQTRSYVTPTVCKRVCRLFLCRSHTRTNLGLPTEFANLSLPCEGSFTRQNRNIGVFASICKTDKNVPEELWKRRQPAKKGNAVEILQTPKSRDKTTAVKFCSAQRFQHLLPRPNNFKS